MIIGLTGPTGSGKSKVSNYFKLKGFKIIDADKLVHDIYIYCNQCIKEVSLKFPEAIKDGMVDRKELAKIVFSNKQKLKELAKIVNPYIINRLREKIKEAKCENIIIDAPTLFESGANDLCDNTIAVLSNEKTRLNRIILRDSLIKVDAVNRINSQPKDDFYIKNADIIIRNDDTIDKLKCELDRVLILLKESNVIV